MNNTPTHLDTIVDDLAYAMEDGEGYGYGRLEDDRIAVEVPDGVGGVTVVGHLTFTPSEASR